ncbi:MAG: hypothetical protein JWN70_5103 [Planctomycetaceae bacterium]|nr:hypothetical protein [Planctomycetaceae bacterium]
MAEAVTLSPRVALLIPGIDDEVIAGRRTDGRWSVFCGGDPVYHFDPQDRLRRAFIGEKLFRSQGTTLARLTRQEAATETVLLRHDLDSLELATFLHDMRFFLARLAEALKLGTVTILESIPADANFLPELASHLNVVLNGQSQLSPALKK